MSFSDLMTIKAHILNLLFALAVAMAFFSTACMVSVFPDSVYRFHIEPSGILVSGLTSAIYHVSPHWQVGLLGSPLVFWSVYCWVSQRSLDGVPPGITISVAFLSMSLWMVKEIIWLHSEMLAIAPRYFEVSRLAASVVYVAVLIWEAGCQHTAWQKWRKDRLETNHGKE